MVNWNMLRNSETQELVDYSGYRMSKKELFMYVAEYEAISGIIAYFFYRSIIALLVASVFVILFLKYKKKQLIKKRQEMLAVQFKELLNAVNGSLVAGYSIENAFIGSIGDMEGFYGKNSYIVKELYVIRRGLANNVSLTALLKDFARRSNVDDIEDFAAVLTIGKQTGGNICGILDSYITVVDEKLSVMQEIETMVSARRFEQKIMNVVPFGIIFYVDLTSRGFFDVLYHNVIGAAVMSVALLLYMISIVMSEKIMNISV